VGPGLREVADQAPAGLVVLLADQPDVVAQLAQSLVQGLRLLRMAHEREVVDQPGRGRQERALAAGQPVIAVAGLVAQHEPVLAQLAPDRLDGAADALVARRQEADEADQQQRALEVL
jgi:hypothetical protein